MLHIDLYIKKHVQRCFSGKRGSIGVEGTWELKNYSCEVIFFNFFLFFTTSMLYIHTVVVLLFILTHKSLLLLRKIIQMHISRIFFLCALTIENSRRLCES